jgi:isopentenyldiphosphate isomerase/intracellular septation protein A
MGLVELVYYRIKNKKFELFILFDTLLIVALGIISIALKNDVFFKIKPALIGVITCAIIGISAFTPGNLLLAMSKRYLKDVEINENQVQLMRKKMQVLFWLFLAYTLLVFYSVWFMSKEAWAFISGGLFYILFGLYFLMDYLKSWHNRRKLLKEEWLPLLNTKGEIMGKAPRSVCHSGKEYLHPVIHMHVINNRGEIYLQKRSMNKLIQPGNWDTAVGGHIAYGEKVETSLTREAYEEIGIRDFTPQLAVQYIWESALEREWVFCFITHYDGIMITNPQEVDEGRFWTIPDIRKNIGKNIFTPNFEEEFKKLFHSGNKVS